jgi:hypothetical protein
MKISYALLVSLMLSAACVAQAEGDSNGTGLFLDPGVSYGVASGNVDVPGAGSLASTRGFGLVLRSGVHFYDRFFAAADARYAFLNFNDNASGVDVNATSWDIAPVIGCQWPEMGPRFYLEYVVAGNLDPASVNGKDLLFDQATGWRVGAGLKVQHLSVNIEWQRLHYGNNRLSSGGTTTTSVTHSAEGLLASVTFPIDFD